MKVRATHPLGNEQKRVQEIVALIKYTDLNFIRVWHHTLVTVHVHLSINIPHKKQIQYTKIKFHRDSHYKVFQALNEPYFEKQQILVDFSTH